MSFPVKTSDFKFEIPKVFAIAKAGEGSIRDALSLADIALSYGVGKLTYEENKSHFTLWSMMAAPLILGNDIRDFIKPDGTVDSDNKVLQILTNKDVIAVNQDKLGIQCKRIKAGLKDVLVKPLENNEVAENALENAKKTKSAKKSEK